MRLSASDRGGRGVPTPDEELKAWKVEMRGMFSTRREERRKELRALLSKATDADQQGWCRERLDFLKSLDLGGKLPAPTGRKAAAAVPRAEERAPETLTAYEAELAGKLTAGLRRAVAA